MKLENKEKSLLFSETILPDIFFTEYLPELSGDCLKLYLYMNFLSKFNKSVKLTDLSKKLSFSSKDLNEYISVLENKGLILKKLSGYIIMDLQEITLNKLYSPNLSASEDRVRSVSESKSRAKAIEHINSRYFQGVMSPSWYNDIGNWFQRFNFDEQVMIALFDECFRRSKLNKAYVQKVAETWGANKVHTWSDLESFSQNQDKVSNVCKIIAKKLGRYNALSEYEVEYVKNWIFSYGYDMDIIELALKRTTVTQSPNFAYLNKVITSWHKNGFKKPEEIELFLKQREKKSASKADKSSDGSSKKVSKLSYAQRTYDNLDFLYANKKTGESGS